MPQRPSRDRPGRKRAAIAWRPSHTPRVSRAGPCRPAALRGSGSRHQLEPLRGSEDAGWTRTYTVVAVTFVGLWIAGGIATVIGGYYV